MNCFFIHYHRRAFIHSFIFSFIAPFVLFVAHTRIYRRSNNLAWGGAKSFSHPPYSQFGLINFPTESGFEHFRWFDAAPPRRFLDFYLEPPNWPPLTPKMTTPPRAKKSQNFFSWFLSIFLLVSVIWCLYWLKLTIFRFVLKFFMWKISF